MEKRTSEVVSDTIKEKILAELHEIKDGEYREEILSLFFLLEGYGKIILANLNKNRIFVIKDNEENGDLEKIYFVTNDDGKDLSKLKKSDIINDDTYCFLKYSTTGQITLYPKQFENLLNTIENDFDEIKKYNELMSQHANIPHYVLSQSVH